MSDAASLKKLVPVALTLIGLPAGLLPIAEKAVDFVPGPQTRALNKQLAELEAEDKAERERKLAAHEVGRIILPVMRAYFEDLVRGQATMVEDLGGLEQVRGELAELIEKLAAVKSETERGKKEETKKSLEGAQAVHSTVHLGSGTQINASDQGMAIGSVGTLTINRRDS